MKTLCFLFLVTLSGLCFAQEAMQESDLAISVPTLKMIGEELYTAPSNNKAGTGETLPTEEVQALNQILTKTDLFRLDSSRPAPKINSEVRELAKGRLAKMIDVYERALALELLEVSDEARLDIYRYFYILEFQAALADSSQFPYVNQQSSGLSELLENPSLTDSQRALVGILSMNLQNMAGHSKLKEETNSSIQIDTNDRGERRLSLSRDERSKELSQDVATVLATRMDIHRKREPLFGSPTHLQILGAISLNPNDGTDVWLYNNQYHRLHFMHNNWRASNQHLILLPDHRGGIADPRVENQARSVNMGEVHDRIWETTIAARLGMAYLPAVASLAYFNFFMYQQSFAAGVFTSTMYGIGALWLKISKPKAFVDFHNYLKKVLGDQKYSLNRADYHYFHNKTLPQIRSLGVQAIECSQITKGKNAGYSPDANGAG